MSSFKAVLLLALATLAWQGTIAEPREGSIHQLIEDIIQIFRVVNTGIRNIIDECVPHNNALINQLPPELQEPVREGVKSLSDFVESVQTRVDELIALAEQASSDLLPTAPCYDNLNAEILASVDGIAKALYGCIVAASEENSDALSSAGADIQRLVDDFQLIADKLSRDIVHCIAPGTQDALQCFIPAFFALEDSIRDILHAIVKIIDDGEVAILLVTESALACASPAFGQLADEYGVWGQQISDCIVAA